MKLTRRRQNMIAGLCTLVVLVGLTTIGVKFAFGSFDQGYLLRASFDAAGQGLIRGSDVKVRGIDIGHVDSIRLVDGRAEVLLFIGAGRDIPRDATFTIRPKTLFGEKFVDVQPGDGEVAGEMFDPDGTLEERTVPAENALGGIELERVLSSLYPILTAVDPQELATVLDTLAEAGDGLGETINRSIVNGDAVLAVTAQRDAETRQFLEALAALSDELAARSPDLVAGAADLNVALPVLTENRESLTALLEQTERVSGQLADLLEGNTAFIESVYTDGQATIDVLHPNRNDVIPLVTGLRQYIQTLAEVARIPVGDGTMMAAVKGLIGGEVCTVFVGLPCTGAADADLTTGPEPAATAPPVVPVAPLVPGLSDGAQDLLDIVTGVAGALGGDR